jgi:type IV pilus assembly protein PilC
MPTFRCDAITAAGQAETATVDAPDRAAAVRQLAARGLTAQRVEAVKSSAKANDRAGAPRADRSSGNASGAAAAGPRLSLGRSVMSRSETASFVRELATGVSAGLPVVPALRTIARSGRTPAQRAMLERMIGDVEHGKTLADAMKREGKPFTELLISLVHAGEVAGRLGEVLTQAAVLLDRDIKLRRQVTSAMVYPAILAALIVVAIVVVVTVIVPQVLSAVTGVVAVLPWPTQVVLTLANLFNAYWWAALGALLALAVLWTQLRKNPSSRLAIDRLILKTPIIGPLARDVAVARFTRTFATLAGAGLPVLTALRITKDTLGNAALVQAIDRVTDDVAHGKTIGEPLEASGYFPPLLVQIVGMGERTGRLDEMMAGAADSFEEKTDQTIKVFTAALQPLLIIGVAPIVVLIISAVILPLIEMQQAIG